MKTKYIVIMAVLVAVLCLGGVATANDTSSVQDQISALIQQIAKLQEQLKALQNQQNTPTVWCHTFNANVGMGQKTGNPDVKALKTVLQKEGLFDNSSVSSEGGYDEELASAVTGFQEKYASEILTPSNLKHGTGFLGKATRAKLNALYGCTKKDKVCTTEARQCSDGSYVSRSGPDCEFAKCPENQCKMDSDCPQIQCFAAPCPQYRCVEGKCVNSNKNGSPSINGISGPTTLTPGQNGTWTITATDPENGTLSYSVFWGDEVNYPTANSAPAYTGDKFSQTTTFYHSYSASGVFTPVFYVRDNSGNMAKSSISVKVGDANTPLIQIISPNGGETYKPGDSINITWKTLNVSTSQTLSTIRLRSYSNGQEYNLAYDILNNGQRTIQIPSSIPEGAYTLEIKSYLNNVLLFDASDSYFKIASSGQQCTVDNDCPTACPTCATTGPDSYCGQCIHYKCVDNKCVAQTQPSIAVTSPNGGETWKMGEARNITWNSQGLTQNDKVYISLNMTGTGPDRFVGNITSSEISALSGSYSWTIPSNITPNDKYQVSIHSIASNLWDESNNYFSIVAP